MRGCQTMPNKPDAANPAMTPQLHFGRHSRRVTDLERSVSSEALRGARRQTTSMKTHFILTLAIATVSPMQAFSQAPAQPPMISVSGSAEVKVPPDEIYLRVGVETRHENLEDAKQQKIGR